MPNASTSPADAVLDPDNAEGAPAYGRLVRLVAAHFRETGCWPNQERMQRDLVRRGEDVDVIGTVAQLPRNVGHAGVDSTVVVTVRGLAMAERDCPELQHFLQVLRLFISAYRGDDETPEVTTEMVAERLGVASIDVTKVRLLLESEGWLTAGGSGDADRWTWVVNSNVRHFIGVTTIEEYIAVVDRITGPRVSAPALWAHDTTPFAWTSVAAADREAILRVDLLHPAIGDAAGALFRDGHTGSAVLEAAKAYRDLVRQKTGLTDLDGTVLMERAFATLTVADTANKSGRGVQDGVKRMAEGAMLALRNVAAHDRHEPDPTETLELLAIFSFLTRTVERAEPSSPPS